MQNGVQFFLTKNGDVLTEGDINGKISKEYFIKVINLNQQEM